jgi:type IV pilus assembly protein PilE
MKTLPSQRSQRYQAGFTLVELMVTIVVASILIAIAVPSYTSQIRKSRRTDAKSALLDLASRQERFYSTNSAYTSDAKNLGMDSTSKTLFQYSVGSSYYQVSACISTTTTIPTSCGTGTAPTVGSNGVTYLLVAVPTGTQAKDTLCGTYTLDNTGVQSNSGNSQTSGCW